MAAAIFGRVGNNRACHEYFWLHLNTKEPAGAALKGDSHGIQERLRNEPVKGLNLSGGWGGQNTAAAAPRQRAASLLLNQPFFVFNDLCKE